MSSTPEILSGDSSIGAWLDNPTGGPILRQLLEQAGRSDKVLRPLRRMALRRFVKMSGGQFTQAAIDDLSSRANSAATGDSSRFEHRPRHGFSHRPRGWPGDRGRHLQRTTRGCARHARQ